MFRLATVVVATALSILKLLNLYFIGDMYNPCERPLLSPVPTIWEDSVRIMGRRVFNTTCLVCHRDSLGYSAPGYLVLASMTPRAILNALDHGKMRQQAAALTEKERIAVAQWLTGSTVQQDSYPSKAFARISMSPKASHIFDYSGWGGNYGATGFRSQILAGITPANIGSLTLKWTFAFPAATIVRSKPAVVGDWLIVGSQFGDVYAIHRKTGQLCWHFQAGAPIRGAIVIGKQGNSENAYFADFATTVYAIDVKSGKEIWHKRANLDGQSATTGSVAVYDNKVFVPITSTEVSSAANGQYNCCYSSGGVVALDATDGHVVWRHRVIEQPVKLVRVKNNGHPQFGPSGGPVWCSPTIDPKRGLLYIGTGENYTSPSTKTSDAVQALNMKTGKLVWNFQATADDTYNVACPYFINCPEKPGPDLDFGMAPILIKSNDGTDILAAGQKSGIIYAFNPENGKRLWQTRIGKGGKLGGIHWGMATDGVNIYASNADNVQGIDVRDSTVIASPGLYALDVLTGKLLWTAPAPDCGQKKDCLSYNSAAPAALPGIVFAGSLDGHMRAYSSADGKVIWDYNTARNYDKRYGISAKGGSIDGPAPVMAEGMLYVNSGYGMFGEMPGNVLIAFGVN